MGEKDRANSVVEISKIGCMAHSKSSHLNIMIEIARCSCQTLAESSGHIIFLYWNYTDGRTQLGR